ncbi:dipeptide ABC transporter ATP-binding protein [Arvimicrobium flavum]|uniref:dipeptide ABC transporter ATP-binding protein n=1 Tax=Arvimicrobium flavum TaxID=3393320 RepID=UPI00237C0F24|nr:ABC transporter ATP-binding protein [Mesorhizobium shangrilense]
MSGNANVVVEIRDLNIALPAGADRPLAVQNLSVELRENEILCVVGESGSGKSLLAGAIMGLLPPGVHVSGGSIRYDGRELSTLDEAGFRPIRGRRIAMIFQEPMTALNPVLTVHEQIDEVLQAHGMTDAAKRQHRILELLEATGLPEPATLQHAYPFRLSGGQRQRVMIAMALALEPDVLIADEPTTALDVTTQKQILSLLREVQQRSKLAVLFITHDFGVVADIASRVAVMQHGVLVEYGGARDVLDQPQHPYTQRLIDAVRGLSREPLLLQGESSSTVLEIANATKTYVTRSGFFTSQLREVHALRNVNLKVEHGETVGLVGESGSGKSTLGQVVVQLLDADAGTIRFNGEDLSAMSRKRFSEVRPKIQMIFQDPYASLNPRHKIGRVLTESQILHGATKEEALARAEAMLEMVSLDRSALRRFPHEFSGGQRQRIGIARALVMEPELIVADEPVSALDVSIQAQVLDLLLDLRRKLKLSMLFITHDLRVAAQLCDRIAVMRKGEIVELDASEKVLRDPQHEYTRLLLNSMPGHDWLAGTGAKASAA